MRLLKRIQGILVPEKVEIDRGDELEEMDLILRSAPGMKEVLVEVLRDVTGGKQTETGAEGFSAIQIVKLGILRKRNGLSYRDLSHATADSLSAMRFLEVPLGKVFSKSTIQSNLKLVKDTTWEKVNECLLRFAKGEKIEAGKVVRGDTTTTETNIHYPTDASLLNDVVRVLNRTMLRIQEVIGTEVKFIDHSRRAKRKLYKINNTHKEEKRHPHYLELIRVTRKTVGYAEGVLKIAEGYKGDDFQSMLVLKACQKELKTYISLGIQVADQAHRRIAKKENVPASEKVLSIFEPHTDIIVKGFRDVVFGHKVSIVTGKSSLVLQLSICDGNPKDSTLVKGILEEHKKVYGSFPEAATFDGCFGSKDNRDFAKEGGVSNITFSKNVGMKIDSLLDNPKRHRRLLNFRAGIEGCISFLKRIFGFDRVLDKTKETFKAALHCATVAYNLTLLARLRLAS